jgi:hypothetical protein
MSHGLAAGMRCYVHTVPLPFLAALSVNYVTAIVVNFRKPK